MKQIFVVVFFFVLISCNNDQRSNFLVKTEDPNQVPAVDLSKMDPSMFEGEELDLPFYLHHFHRLANAVVMEGQDQGFINISVWRAPKDNKPYNARIMENILSLVYFYTEDKPWNPYFGMPQLRDRIEKALNFWVSIQSEEGKFSEYGPEKWNLAATAFATKFNGDALLRLSKGPAIDQKTFDAANQALRKAIIAVFTLKEFQEFGRSYSNQYTNVWSGALAYLAFNQDPEVQQLFDQRLNGTMSEFQSPVGYFYEKDGPDWSYNLGTHENNLMMAWHYVQDTPNGDIITEKSSRFVDWLSYNSAPEPGQDFFVLNRAVECRQNEPYFEPIGGFIHQGMPLGENIPANRIYLLSQAEVDSVFAQQRLQLKNNWPEVSEFEIGEFHAYSPYAFLHRRVDKWYPTEEQKQQALQNLPFKSDNNFLHQRKDDRFDAVYSFIRQPNYFVAFNSGEKIQNRQRYGIGLLWHPEAGALLQSQTGSNIAAWGTKGMGEEQVYEASDLQAVFKSENTTINLQDSIANQNEIGEVVIEYPLGQNGNKRLTFSPSQVTVEINHPGEFTEILPLITSGENITINQEMLNWQKYGHNLRIEYSEASAEMGDPVLEIKNLNVTPVTLKAKNKLVYHFKFEQLL